MNIIPNKSIILAALVASIALTAWRKQEVHNIIDSWNPTEVISGKEQLMQALVALSRSNPICSYSDSIQAPIISSVDGSQIFALYPDYRNDKWDYIVRNINSPHASVKFTQADLRRFFPTCYV